MRAVVALASLVAAVAACHGDDHHGVAVDLAQPVAIASVTPAPPAPIVACERYADLLGKSVDLDVDPEVRDLLRGQSALLRAALRDPRPADRDELAVRCTAGLVDLARVPRDGSYGGVVGGMVGGVAAAPPPPAPVPPSPAPTTVSGLTPSCRRLLDLFDRMARCPDVGPTMQDSIRQARSIMFDSYSQMPQDVRDSMEDSCRTAADAYDQVLASFHCP